MNQQQLDAGGALAAFRRWSTKSWSIVAMGFVLAFTLLPIAGQLYGDRASGWLMVDFRAYYCAALITREGRDPYLVHPLHECESAPAAALYRAPANVTVPAPYPPYALAFIAPLTFLPLTTAAALWLSLLATSCVAAAIALARVTRLSFFVTWASLALSLALVSIPGGQLVPICVAALIVAALILQRGRVDLAAVAIALAMIEPHVALPAAIAFFIRYRSSRLILALLFVLFATVSLAFGGIPINAEYLTSVLPAHALAEVSRDNQYSLTTVLASFGVSDSLAVLAGSISYAIAVLLGAVVALRLTRRYLEPGFIVLIPPAFCLLGGSFVHTVEIAAAVPVCLLLFVRAQELRPWLMVALLLLCVPWMSATSVTLVLAPIVPVAYLTYVLCGRQRALALRAGVASSIAVLALFVLSSHASQAHVFHAAHPPIDARLAEASWRAFVLGNTSSGPLMWLLRAPTWAGLLLLIAAGVTLSLKGKAAYA